MVLSRGPKMCNFIDWKDMKLVYRRYASLYFVVGVDQEDNELVTMEVIHQFVEGLDTYFGNVCELDQIDRKFSWAQLPMTEYLQN